MFLETDTRIQFRDSNNNLICGYVKRCKPCIDLGAEIFGCDYSFVIAAGGTRNGNKLRKDLLCDTNGWHDVTDKFFIGTKTNVSLCAELNYSGIIADFQTQPDDIHDLKLWLKNARINSQAIGNVCLKKIGLYGFYNAVQSGITTFTDTTIAFSKNYAIDIATAHQTLFFERVVVKGGLQVVSRKGTNGIVELVDVALGAVNPKIVSIAEMPSITIQSTKKIKVVNTRRILTGNPVAIQSNPTASFVV